MFQERLDHRDPLAHLGHTDLLGLKEMALQAPLESKDLQVLQDFLDLASQECQVCQESQEVLGNLDNKVNKVPEVKMDNEVWPGHLVLLDPQAYQE